MILRYFYKYESITFKIASKIRLDEQDKISFQHYSKKTFKEKASKSNNIDAKTPFL